jgi:hypothetical protein
MCFIYVAKDKIIIYINLIFNQTKIEECQIQFHPEQIKLSML